MTQKELSSSYLTNAFYLTGNNASIHIELKPVNFSIGYLFVMKLGYTPILNSTFADFTSFAKENDGIYFVASSKNGLNAKASFVIVLGNGVLIASFINQKSFLKKDTVIFKIAIIFLKIRFAF